MAKPAERRHDAALRRRVAPYFLLGPGTIWLVLFFVVPLFYLGKLSLESGFVGSLRIQLELVELQRSALLYDTQFVRSFVYAGTATLLTLVHRLSAGLRDRLQGGAMAERAAVRGRRPVLHHLPDPDHRLGDDPLRRKPGDEVLQAIGLLPAATCSRPAAP